MMEMNKSVGTMKFIIISSNELYCIMKITHYIKTISFEYLRLSNYTNASQECADYMIGM